MAVTAEAAELGRCGAEHGAGVLCVGAALASHGRSHRFDPCHAHHDLAAISLRAANLLAKLQYPPSTRTICEYQPTKGIEGIDQGIIGIG
jgi:hypothetical protein